MRPIEITLSRTRLSDSASNVSAPAMPGALSENGRRLSSGPRGSWPDAMTSIVPSAMACIHANRSLSDRRGGDSRAKVRKSEMALSDRNRCAGVMPQVTRRPLAFAARIRSSPPAVVTCRKCTRAPLSSANNRSRAIANVSATTGALERPNKVAVSPAVATAWPATPESSLCTMTGRSNAAQ